MSHRSLFAFLKTTTLYIIRKACPSAAGLIAAGALAGCGGAAPPTPVRIIVPPTRTPAAAIPVVVATTAVAPPASTPLPAIQPTLQPTSPAEASPTAAKTPRPPTATPGLLPSPQPGGTAVSNRSRLLTGSCRTGDRAACRRAFACRDGRAVAIGVG